MTPISAEAKKGEVALLPYAFLAIAVGYETSLLKNVKIGFPVLLMTFILRELCGFEQYKFVGIAKRLSAGRNIV
jgi:hypothetical protein